MKTIEELNAEIERTAKVLEDVRALAERAKDQFLDVVAAHVRDLVPAQVKLLVERQHEVTKALGTEKLGQLKNSLATFDTEAPAKVRTWLDRDDLWPHRPNFSPPKDSSYFPHSYNRSSGNVGPKPIDDALRQSLNETYQALLRRFGYKVKDEYLHPDWSKVLNPALNRYGESQDAFEKARSAHRAAVEARDRHEAAALWDKA
jgi:hypothetical protein